MIKNTLLAISFVLFAATAFAKDVVFEACTSDHVLAASFISLEDDTPAGLEHKLRVIYAKVGKSMTFEDFSSAKGFIAFRDALSDEDKAAFLAILQPQAQGECK